MEKFETAFPQESTLPPFKKSDEGIPDILSQTYPSQNRFSSKKKENQFASWKGNDLEENFAV